VVVNTLTQSVTSQYNQCDWQTTKISLEAWSEVGRDHTSHYAMSTSPTVTTLSCLRDFADSAEQTNVQIPVKYSQPLTWWSTLQDVTTVQNHFVACWDIHTDRLTCWQHPTISAIAITAGKNTNTNTNSRSLTQRSLITQSIPWELLHVDCLHMPVSSFWASCSARS